MTNDNKNTKIWTPLIDYTTVNSVNKAIDFAKQYNASIYMGVESIVVQPGGGDGRTKGYVTNRVDPQKGDQSRIIYLYLDVNKNRAKETLKKQFPNIEDNILNKYLDEATTIVVTNTIIHEQVHVMDELKSGEGPAEDAEKKAENFINKKWDELYEKIQKEVDKKTAYETLSINKIIKLTNLFHTLIYKK